MALQPPAAGARRVAERRRVVGDSRAARAWNPATCDRPGRRLRRRMMLLAIFGIVFGSMLVEARRAARNERAQRARGGIEPPGDVYRVMSFVYPAAFLAMIAEGAWRGLPGA